MEVSIDYVDINNKQSTTWNAAVRKLRYVNDIQIIEVILKNLATFSAHSLSCFNLDRKLQQFKVYFSRKQAQRHKYMVMFSEKNTSAMWLISI